ncbi:MAG: ribosome biogenesis GTPase Der [bacterium]|nr:ribosome biogenesis GTPase Der [bacterium]
MKNPTSQSSENQELPLVAIIGPTNAGKSTLFNRITGTPQAITAREESTTRDRVYGDVEWQGHCFTAVDTGGLVDDKSELYRGIRAQMFSAVEEADLILFVYDAREGLQPQDQQFLDKLRSTKTIWLIGNKVDAPTIDKQIDSLEYLGLPFYKISAVTGKGVGDLLEEVCKALPKSGNLAPVSGYEPVIALVGRPNVGKSTLLNALTKTDRAVVSPIAGTTRDIVTAKLTIGKKDLLLADTAGVRRRGKIDVGVEKFSVKRTLAAINFANIVVVIVDAQEGTTRADLHLIYFANKLQKPVLVIFNKSDLLGDRPITFHHHIAKFDQLITSALTGEGLGAVLEWIEKKAQESEDKQIIRRS